MLDHTVTQERKARHSKYQEDFTPIEVVERLYDGCDDLYTDFTKTLCDPCCGIGYILLYAVEMRLTKCKSTEDIYNALRTIYGVDIVYENVTDCRKNIHECVQSYSEKSNIPVDDNTITDILKHNIACADFFEWDFDKWCKKPKVHQKQLPFASFLLDVAEIVSADHS